MQQRFTPQPGSSSAQIFTGRCSGCSPSPTASPLPRSLSQSQRQLHPPRALHVVEGQAEAQQALALRNERVVLVVLAALLAQPLQLRLNVLVEQLPAITACAA